MHVPNAMAPIFIKETLLNLKSYIEPHILIVGNLHLTEVMNQVGIYRTFHPNTKQYTFFSVPHKTISKVDHILSHRARNTRYMKIKITRCV